MKKYLALLLVLAPLAAFTQNLKISQLPVASTPLGGTELVPVVQGGVTKQTTVSAIGSTFSGGGGGGTVTGTGAAHQLSYWSSTSALTGDANLLRTVYSLEIQDGSNLNTYLGFGVGNGSTTGGDNLAVGNNSLHAITSGDDNVAIGAQTLPANTSGSFNIAINTSMQYNTTGSYNIAIGNAALTTNVTGSDNIAIGYLADQSIPANLSNTIALGQNAEATESNELVIVPSIHHYNLSGVDYFLPSAQGAANTILSNDGSGNLTWAQVGLTTGVTGTLPIANGGTGASSAATALTNLLPSQTGNSGMFLTTNGTAASWASVSSGAGTVYPATQIVFGDGSTPGGVTSNNLFYNSSNGSFEAGDGGATELELNGSSDLFYLELQSAQCINISPNTGQYYFGDLNTFNNGTSFKIDDPNTQYIFNKPDFNINGVHYSLTGTQGASGTVLSNDGSGNLTWAQVGLTTGVTGTLPIANGGTGATSATAALTNLLPSQTGNIGMFLTTNGTGASWASVSGGSAPVYSQFQIPYGDGSTSGGVTSNNFEYIIGAGGAQPAEFYVRDNQGADANLFEVMGYGAGPHVTAERTIFYYPTIGIDGVTYVFPSSQGAASTVLTNDGSGNLSWASAGGSGTVTSITASSPLTGGTITTSGSIGLGTVPIANGGTNSTTALSGSSIMVSNGSSVIQGAAGTATTVLHGNTSGVPSYSAVSLANDVTGNLSVNNLNGGSGASSSTFWRGDGTWATPSSGSGSGAPVYAANEIPFGNGSTAGGVTNSNLTYNPSGGTYGEFSVGSTAGAKMIDAVTGVGESQYINVTIGDVDDALASSNYFTVDENNHQFIFYGSSHLVINGSDLYFPMASAPGVLTNDGSGNLTWASGSAQWAFDTQGNLYPVGGAPNLSGAVNNVIFNNTAYTSPLSITTGAQNTLMGDYSGLSLTSESDNTFIGYQAGVSDVSNSGTVLIGEYTSANGLANSIAIGNNAAATTSNQIVFGNGVTNWLTSGGNWVIPTSNAPGVLTNDGSGNLSWSPAGGNIAYSNDMPGNTGTITLASFTNPDGANSHTYSIKQYINVTALTGPTEMTEDITWTDENANSHTFHANASYGVSVNFLGLIMKDPTDTPDIVIGLIPEMPVRVGPGGTITITISEILGASYTFDAGCAIEFLY